MDSVDVIEMSDGTGTAYDMPIGGTTLMERGLMATRWDYVLLVICCSRTF